MASMYTLEQVIDQENTMNDFIYLQYFTDVPAPCDISFRKFITNWVFDNAIMIPVRSGHGRKWTTQGVLKVLAGTTIPAQTRFKNSVLQWTITTELVFEHCRRELATKVYFRGFPIDTTLGEVAEVFGRFGHLEYVFMMGITKRQKRSNRQGYVIFESRKSVDQLFASKGGLVYRGCHLYIAEYKSKFSTLTLAEKENPSLKENHDHHDLIVKSNSNEFSISTATQKFETSTYGKELSSYLPNFSPQLPKFTTEKGTNSKRILQSIINSQPRVLMSQRSNRFLRYRNEVDANSNHHNLRFNTARLNLRILESF